MNAETVVWSVVVAGLVVILGFLLFVVYAARVAQHSDPPSVPPEHPQRLPFVVGDRYDGVTREIDVATVCALHASRPRLVRDDDGPEAA